MEKCHLASIRLPLSSPFRSERSGEGLLKRVLKGCEPPFAFEIIPSFIFISTEHVKHVHLKFLQPKGCQIFLLVFEDREMWSCNLALLVKGAE